MLIKRILILLRIHIIILKIKRTYSVVNSNNSHAEQSVLGVLRIIIRFVGV